MVIVWPKAESIFSAGSAAPGTGAVGPFQGLVGVMYNGLGL